MATATTNDIDIDIGIGSTPILSSSSNGEIEKTIADVVAPIPTLQLPPIRTHNSPDAISRMSSICGHAFTSEPANVMIASERLGHPSRALTPADLRTSFEARLTAKLALGGLIVEAADWAVVAAWEDPDTTAASERAPPPPYRTPESLRLRPLFHEFIALETAAHDRYMALPDGGGVRPHWHFTMLAKDHSRPGPLPKGAVRALTQPILQRVREENDKAEVKVKHCAWMVAGSPRARDIYSCLGFRLLETCWVGVGKLGLDGLLQEGGPGMPFWCMMYD